MRDRCHHQISPNWDPPAGDLDGSAVIIFLGRPFPVVRIFGHVKLEAQGVLSKYGELEEIIMQR